MKKRIFKIVNFFLISSGLCLFPQSNFSMAQAEMLQPRSGASLSEELLETFALPEGPIAEEDMSRVEAVIRQVVSRISESIKTSGQSKSQSDVRPIMSAVLTFQDWLTRQGCVARASNWYVQGIDSYNEDIFISYPGQVPFDILFDMQGDTEAEDRLYRLLIFVNTTDLLRFAGLLQNKEILVWPDEEVLYLVP